MNLKKTIIFIICIIIILVIILTTILLSTSNKKQNNNLKEDDEILLEYNVPEKVKNPSTFFLINSCVDKYITQSYFKDKSVLFNLLSKQYISENNITENNILSKITTYDMMQLLKINKMHVVYNNEQISTYYIEGTVQDDEEEQYTEEKIICLAVQLDVKNRTFAIIPNDKVENSRKSSNVKSIEINNSNIYGTINIKETQIAEIYLNDFIKTMAINAKEAYELLDKEYRNIKFKTQEDFENYINNTESLYMNKMINIEIYNEEDDCKKYVVTTEYGNTYIFKETAIMEYTVMLDDYTIENEQFTQKYNKADRQNKGVLNIDKFFKMINNKDYTSAYNVLDENFKQTYFKTEQEFIDFMELNIYEINKVKYETYMDVTGEIISYTTKLTDYTGEKTGEIEFDVVMKLINENEFKMSFTIKK